MVYCFDNTALQDICTKFQDMETPKFNHMNNIIACCMSGLTSCLRRSETRIWLLTGGHLVRDVTASLHTFHLQKRAKAQGDLNFQRAF